MAKTDFTLAGKNGTTPGRVHRATCKRIPTGEGTWQVTVKEALELDPKALVEATLCTSCKPNAAKIYIAEAEECLSGTHAPAEETPAPAEETPAEEDLLGTPAPAEETPAEEEDLIGTPTSHTVAVREAAKPDPNADLLQGISKHYHQTLIKEGLPLLDGRPARSLFLEAFQALRAWRRQDAEYKALPPQDTKWVTSARYAWERDFLLGFIQQEAGAKVKATYADTGVPARRGAKAARDAAK